MAQEWHNSISPTLSYLIVIQKMHISLSQFWHFLIQFGQNFVSQSLHFIQFDSPENGFIQFGFEQFLVINDLYILNSKIILVKT